MSLAVAIIGLLTAPLLQALCVWALQRPPGLRDVIHIGFSLANVVFAARLVQGVIEHERARVAIAQPLPNVDLAFNVEPLGALMAAVIAGLGVLHATHTSGIVRATHDKEPARLMSFIALTNAATMAAMLSANLFTFFVAYQAVTLAAFPLVAHRGERPMQRAARIFLATLLAASVGLFLPAMIWTYAISGALDFQAGGVLAGHVDPAVANILLSLFVFGLAMAALPPLHRWLTAASVAPHPALVSLYALSVLPAGGVGVIKIAAYVFGPALYEAALAARLLIALAGVSACIAALIALSKQDIRERLAYSCLAQAMAVIIGAMLALPAGLFAAALQVVALATAAATLLMASGTVNAITMRHNAADYSGLGRVMPWTFAGFAVASASMIGMPPFAGAWAKLWLITATASRAAASQAASQPVQSALFLTSAGLIGLAAVLTFAHLGLLTANALAGKAPTDAFRRPDGASILLAAPVIACAAATLWLLVLADPLASFLAPMWTPQP